MELSHFFRMWGMHLYNAVVGMCIETVEVPAELPEEYTDNTFARRPDCQLVACLELMPSTR